MTIRREVRRLLENPTLSHSDIAKLVGVSRSRIGQIADGLANRAYHDKPAYLEVDGFCHCGEPMETHPRCCRCGLLLGVWHHGKRAKRGDGRKGTYCRACRKEIDKGMPKDVSIHNTCGDCFAVTWSVEVCGDGIYRCRECRKGER